MYIFFKNFVFARNAYAKDREKRQKENNWSEKFSFKG